MKIIDLIQEIEDILETSGGIPLSGRVLVDGDEIRDILHELKDAMPKSIQEAEKIKNERTQILTQAREQAQKLLQATKLQSSRIMEEARRASAKMVDEDELTYRVQFEAEEMMRETTQSMLELKADTIDYIDELFYSFQQQMDDLRINYAEEMVREMNDLFENVHQTVSSSRRELRSMASGLEYEMNENQGE